MLGYVKTNAEELRVREHLYYRALYCGLCHRMGKCTGHCSRMTLNYDFVFLAAVRYALTGEKPIFKKQRCLLHPFRPRMAAQKSEALDFCADASALLVYHKIADDKQDERGLKKARAYLLQPFCAIGYRRAKRRHASLDQAVRGYLSALSSQERSPSTTGADACAAHFANLMEAVFADGLEGTAQRLAKTIGKSVGHWIYLVDAADDFAQDRKRGRFNPYLRLFGETPSAADWENLRLSLTAQLCDAERAYLLIDPYPAPELREILANILYLGMPAVAARVTSPQSKKTTDKKEPTP